MTAERPAGYIPAMNILDTSAIVVSFGNELRGDDGAGILFGRLIADADHIPVIEGGSAPENITGVIAVVEPDIILIADTADLHESPGTYRLVDPFRLSFDIASTHGTSALWCEYMRVMTGAELFMIGFQPEFLDFGSELTPSVSKGVRTAAGQCIELGISGFIAHLQTGAGL